MIHFFRKHSVEVIVPAEVSAPAVVTTPAEAARILSQHARTLKARKDAMTAALRADNAAGRVCRMPERGAE